MWTIPSGQGKSRTIAMIALILLLTNATTKVHLVFDSEHFMNRDKREFNDWWEMHGITNVEYHVGLYFETKPNDIILIDEAD
jgi:predicted ATPase